MKVVYCIQNSVVEEVLKKNRVINKNSIIIKTKKDLTQGKLNSIKPDLIMFPHWSHIVPDSITKKYTCICFHSAPLPFGRGGSPIQNMIKRGFKETEVCSLKMENELDSGPIYLRTKVQLSGNLDDILKRVYGVVASQIKTIKKKKIVPKPQNGEVIKFKRLSIKDNLVNFDGDLSNAYDQIRMLDSKLYPSAFFGIGDYFFFLKDAKIKKNELSANVSIKRKISIRKIKLSDSKEIWKWRNDTQTRSMFKEKDYVDFKEHKRWFNKKFKDKNCYFYIGETQNLKAGVVRIDINDRNAEVSINLNPKFRGISISQTLLKDSINNFLSKNPNYDLVANINKKNKPSIKIFTNLGFQYEKSLKNFKRYVLYKSK